MRACLCACLCAHLHAYILAQVDGRHHVYWAHQYKRWLIDEAPPDGANSYTAFSDVAPAGVFCPAEPEVNCSP